MTTKTSKKNQARAERAARQGAGVKTHRPAPEPGLYVTIHLPVTREMFGELAGLAKVEDRTIVSAARTMIAEGLEARQRAAQARKIAEATMSKWGQHEQDRQNGPGGPDGQAVQS